MKHKIIDFFKTFFPASRTEFLLFVVFLLSYGTLASYIALNYRIVFDNRIPWDAYFSFDNRAIVMNGGGFERHPLSNYFFDALRNLALWVSGGKMNADFRLVLALCSTAMISLVNVQIFKYLRNIIRLPVFLSVFLVVMFSFFVTPVLLSFTPETYTYTLFFLTGFNYYAALKLRRNKRISGVALVLSGVAAGGMTITNIVKVYLPVLFEKGLFRSWKKFGNAVLRAVISFAVFALLFLNRLNFQYEKIFTKAEQQYDKFSNADHVPVWDMIWSWFFGGNILFSGFELRDYHNQGKTFFFKALFMETYSSWLPYFFVAVIFILVFWSYFKNFRNRFVQILMLSFLVDIVIHCVMKFGLHTSYIYGGHFVFVIPVMLGWLFYAYRKNGIMLSAILSVLAVTFVFIAMNNMVRMEEFFVFLNKYYLS
ncbi:MAG: DUF6080 domain-containing protein [Bergeyella sp.]